MTSAITAEEASATLKYLYAHSHEVEVTFFEKVPKDLPGVDKSRTGFFAVLRKNGHGGAEIKAASPVLHENDSHEHSADVWYPVKESKDLTDKNVAAAVRNLLGTYKQVMEEENRGRLVGKYGLETVDDLVRTQLQ